MEVMILGYRGYSFNDNQTGRLVQGVNVWIYSLSEAKGQDEGGFIPAKVSLPYESLGFMRDLKFPCKADTITEQRMTSRGIETKVIGFKVK